MSTQHQHSRKSFIVKLLGIGAAASVLPGLAALAKRPETTHPADTARTDHKNPFAIRADARSIARTDNA